MVPHFVLCRDVEFRTWERSTCENKNYTLHAQMFTICFLRASLAPWGDKVSMLSHTYPHKPLSKMKQPSTITRLAVHFIRGLMFVLVICRHRKEYGHAWHGTSLLRPGVTLNNTTQNMNPSLCLGWRNRGKNISHYFVLIVSIEKHVRSGAGDDKHISVQKCWQTAQIGSFLRASAMRSQENILMCCLH